MSTSAYVSVSSLRVQFQVIMCTFTWSQVLIGFIKSREIWTEALITPLVNKHNLKMILLAIQTKDCAHYDFQVMERSVSRPTTPPGLASVGWKGTTAPQFNFTIVQMDALESLIDYLEGRFPNAEIRGHNEVSTKPCPCFNVKVYFGDR